MKTVFSSGYITVKEAARNYDFIATIENETDRALTLEIDGSEAFEIIGLSPFDWVGLLADKYGYTLLSELKDGNFTIAEG